MKKACSLIAIIVLILGGMLLSITQPVTALGTPTPESVYVDKTRQDGNEDGTEGNPYSEYEEGQAYAQSLDYGGKLYVRDQPNGEYEYYGVYKGVTAQGGGVGLPALTVYFLLAILSLILILAGWRLKGRSHHLQN